MRSLQEYLNETQNYFKSYTDAVQYALKDVERAGLDYDEDEYFNIVATGSKKPSVGKTTSWKLPLYRNGKAVKKMLIVNVYGMESGKYELNSYIS